MLVLKHTLPVTSTSSSITLLMSKQNFLLYSVSFVCVFSFFFSVFLLQAGIYFPVKSAGYHMELLLLIRYSPKFYVTPRTDHPGIKL